MEQKISKSPIITSIASAFLASLCCIAPVIAIIGGISGIAASFLWLEPMRPIFVILAVGSLSFAWYKALRRKKIDCECDEPNKISFLSKKKFLAPFTGVIFILISFPYYSHTFFKASDKVTNENFRATSIIQFNLSGMTCRGCEEHVKQKLKNLKGVEVKSISHENGTVTILFDKNVISEKEIEQSVKKTEYKIKEKKVNDL